MTRLLSILLTLAMFAVLSACDAPPLERFNVRDEVTINATFLTEDPENIIFPVKVLFAIDCSGSMGGTVPGMEGGSDPEGLRLDAVREFVNTYNTDEYPNVSFEVMLWNLSVMDTTGNDSGQPGFTRSATEISRVLDGANNQSMTDYLGTIDAIRVDIENDIHRTAQQEGGADTLVRTKYIVLFFSDGLPNVPDGIGSSMTQADADIFERVEELNDMVNENGVGGFSFHTFLLSALFGPGDESDMQRAINTLQQMAHRAGGIFIEFENAEAIDFVNVTDLRLTAEYTIEFALAFNQNVKPGTDLVHTDSDGDWLNDAEELIYDTDPQNPDTDYDGMGDYFEIKVSSPQQELDPLENDSPCQASEDGTYPDTDFDGLTDCEEYIKGTNRYMTDTDQDGIPDGVEFYMGTNPLIDEMIKDSDFDGNPDWLEVRAHTNVLASDPQVQRDNSYQYNLIDQGYPRDAETGSLLPMRQFNLTVSNIDIMNTLGYTVDGVTYLNPGDNIIRLYIAQRPADLPNSPLIYRMAEIQINYNEAVRDIYLTPNDFELLD
ncbi:MAG: hypothetical protein JW927_14780 [Deltaproteobacteria bacterium]|nr:hypothetical protein [Deltaproteobacteria bacterium]